MHGLWMYVSDEAGSGLVGIHSCKSTSLMDKDLKPQIEY